MAIEKIIQAMIRPLIILIPVLAGILTLPEYIENYYHIKEREPQDESHDSEI